MKVVTFERCPAVCHSQQQNEYKGYDVEVIQEISNRLNFTIEKLFLRGFQKWGTLHDNKSVSGALLMLRNKQAQIGIGNYYLRENRMRFLDASVTYYAIPIVFVIPPGRSKL